MDLIYNTPHILNNQWVLEMYNNSNETGGIWTQQMLDGVIWTQKIIYCKTKIVIVVFRDGYKWILNLVPLHWPELVIQPPYPLGILRNRAFLGLILLDHQP